MKRYQCPVLGCGREAEFMRFECEEVVIPSGKTLDQMPKTRKGHVKPLGVQRIRLVRCPVHGLKGSLHIGHHVSVKLF
jgi:hypothetical protein